MYKFEYDVPVEQFFSDDKGILDTHWKELANYPDKIKLNPDIDKYKFMQQNNVLKNICVYNESKLIGYCVLFCTPHPHYKDDVFVSVDVFYVDPEYRSGTIGIRLIKETEKVARSIGASVLLYHTKISHPTLEKMIHKLGYNKLEHISGKCLKE